MSAAVTDLIAGLIKPLGWALVHFVWQGAVIAALLAVVLLFLRKHSADFRYFVSCLALAAMAVSPVITTVRLAAAEPRSSANAGHLPSPVSVMEWTPELSPTPARPSI